MLKKLGVLFFFQYYIFLVGFSQTDTIFLNNPSFEGIPRTGIILKGWTNCNDNQEIVPDIRKFSNHRKSY